MNQVSEERKDAVTKTLAIIGFVAAILFAVWLAVQVVSVIPSAFSSLASIADSVNNYDKNAQLIVVNDTSVVNAGEAMTVSWSDMTLDGDYSFSYGCTDGAALSLRTGGEIIDLNCGESINLHNSNKVEIMLESEKQRFIDVPYTVTFSPKSGAEDTVTESKITVVNASIPTTGIATEEIKEETIATPEPEVPAKPAGSTNSNGGYVAGTPTTIKVPIYAIPTSDPKGTTDLAVTFLGVGILTNNDTFVRAGTIGTDQTGAFQFEVKNLGTKTSDTWSYEADLPSGISYDSDTQKALKPNEKAIITIGFDGISQTGTETFGAKISTKSDTKSNNNSFTWAVKIVE